MISRRGIIAFLLLTGLGLFFYLYEVRGGRNRQTLEIEEKKVFHLEEEAVQEITLEKPGEEIRLRKTDEGWTLEAPVTAPADDSAVEVLLASLTRTTIQERLGPVDDLSEYGLDQPAVQVELSGSADEQNGLRQRLQVGDESPTTADFFALVGDDPEVVLVSSGVRQAQDIEVLKLRDRKLIDLKVWKVDRIALHRGEETLDFRKENGHWHLEEPFRTPADDGTLGDLISHFGRLEARGFPAEDPQDLSTYGLDRPAAEVTIDQEDWREPRRFAFGKEDGKGNRYARRLDRTAVMELEEEIWPKLTLPLEEMRRSVLFDLGRWNVAGVDLEDSQGKLVLRKNDQGDWQFATGTAVASGLEDLLDAVEGLKATGFLDRETGDLSRFGLEAARLRAAIWTEEELGEAGAVQEVDSSVEDLPTATPVQPFEIRVGGPSGADEVFIQDVRWPTVFRVPRDQVARLEEQVSLLRDLLAMSLSEEIQGTADRTEEESGSSLGAEPSPGG